jgi:hypothetical protein
MQLDFNKPLLQLDGTPAKDQFNEEVSLGKLLGNQLASHNQGDAVKIIGWAQKCFRGYTVEVDKSDFKTLKDFIASSQQLTNLMKAQMLEVCDDAEEVSRKKKLQPAAEPEGQVSSNI